MIVGFWRGLAVPPHVANQRFRGSRPSATTVDCGIRLVEGRHRAYLTDFIRDARAGGCTTGVPPNNLGFRLVVEDDRRAGSPAQLVRAR